MPVIPAADISFLELPGRLSADPLPATVGAGAETGYSVRIVRIPSGPRRPHQHPRSDEVCYVAAGDGVAWEGDVSTPVAVGDVIVVPQGVPHATVAHGSGLTLVCFFPDGNLDSNLVELEGPLRT